MPRALSLLFLLVNRASVAAEVRGTAAPIYILDSSFPKVTAAWPPSGLDRPTGVAVVVSTTGDAEVHVAQRNASLPFVYVFNHDGDVIRTWGSATGPDAIVSPHGLYGQNTKTVWLADISGATVREYSSTGALLGEVGTPGKPGAGLAPPQFSAAADVAVDAVGGRVFISDGDGGSNNRVLVLEHANLSHVLLHVGGAGATPGKLSSPHSVAWHVASGTFWVADRGNTRIQVFDGATGAVAGEWTAADCFPGGAPWGIRFDATRGRVLVADGTIGALYVLSIPTSPQASVRTGLRGTGATATDSLPTALGPCVLLQNISIGVALVPHEIAIDDATGDVYVVGVGKPPLVVRFTLAPASTV